MPISSDIQSKTLNRLFFCGYSNPDGIIVLICQMTIKNIHKCMSITSFISISVLLYFKFNISVPHSHTHSVCCAVSEYRRVLTKCARLFGDSKSWRSSHIIIKTAGMEPREKYPRENHEITPLVEKDSEALSASQRVRSILGEDIKDRKHERHPLFSQMSELSNDGEEMEWRETARWIKFEENVEEGGNRWSKPHVATLSLHSLFKLRKLLLNGCVILDSEAASMEKIADLMICNMIHDDRLSHQNKDEAKKILLKRHRHQYQMKQQGLPLSRPGKNRETKTSPKNDKGNWAFRRKISPEAEASNILVGEVDFLDEPLSAFIRLNKASIMENLTEVPVPTRFLFVVLGPACGTSGYSETGRAMATLMTDEVFSEVAYRARNRSHLLAAIDEFLDEVTVLPPGEWDPAIRLEPPALIPSQDARKRLPEDVPGEGSEEEEEERMRENSGLVRTGVLFGGLANDLKRKTPWYWSDFKDALSLQCIASWIFLYFACLAPIITFGGLLSDATGRHMAAMESLLAGLVCGVVYGLFSGQPLSILGSTGPVLVFEKIVYDSCLTLGWDYLSFRFWIGTWIAVILLVLVAIDASASVCLITAFTEEDFAALIAFIYIYEAFGSVLTIGKKYPIQPPYVDSSSDPFSSSIPQLSTTLTNHTICQDSNGTLSESCFTPLTPPYAPDIFLMSILLFFGTFIISIQLKAFKNALFFPSKVRQFVSDFAVIIAIVAMALLDYYILIPTPKLEVPNELKPTLPNRGWIVSPFSKNPPWSIMLALPPALLGTILIFMDQQITAVIVNRKEHNLRKGCGYHLDLFILAILIQICTTMGLPWFVAATVLSLNHVHSLRLESECTAPGDKPRFLGVREQRVTHVLIFLSIGLSVFLTPMLRHIPMPVLYGVFLYMGVASLQGMQFLDRILIMFMPKKYQPDYPYIRKVPIGRVHLYTLIQIACLAGLWLIKSFSQTSILFPIMLVVMVGVRKSLDYVFTKRELKVLDAVMPSLYSKNHQRQVRGFCAKISKFVLGPKLVLNKQYEMCNKADNC
ncbi:hypothetical protein JTB14_019481 [Gonioctena quinquepunctata]|nr:hypothetical protein JTB14_019481 [Gonioctena quinquepunctata]